MCYKYKDMSRRHPVCVCVCSETRSRSVAQVGPELTVLLSQLPES